MRHPRNNPFSKKRRRTSVGWCLSYVSGEIDRRDRPKPALGRRVVVANPPQNKEGDHAKHGGGARSGYPDLLAWLYPEHAPPPSAPVPLLLRNAYGSPVPGRTYFAFDYRDKSDNPKIDIACNVGFVLRFCALERFSSRLNRKGIPIGRDF